jgi:DNA-directed RNA polymerase subunit alpha
MEVWTNGAILPEDAIALASMTLIDYFNPFYSLKREQEFKRMREMDEKEVELRKILATEVSELELSVRCANCLRNANIITLADLAQKTEAEMMQFSNFGKKSLQELIEVLAKYGLSFGMDLSGLLKDETSEES